MKILLTGASGNIGSSALQELIRQDHVVRCLVRKSKANEKWARTWQDNSQVEIYWGDIQQAADVTAAVSGQEAIIHLAFVIPPMIDEQPLLAYKTNIEGTRHLLAAAQKSTPQPRILFGSSFDVFGFTQHLAPPRRVSDPVQVTGTYSEQKIACEEMVKDSGLTWSIYRFSDVPPRAARKPHPVMFRIPLNTRMEVLHTADAGLALANGLQQEIGGKILLLGGGSTCQVHYREYLARSLEAAGIGMLPENAFGTDPYSTDWLDTSESEALLHYQRHTFEEIIQEITAASVSTVQRWLVRLLRPLVRRQILGLSPYYKQAQAKQELKSNQHAPEA